MCRFPSKLLKTNSLQKLRRAIELERLNAPHKTLADLEPKTSNNVLQPGCLPLPRYTVLHQ